MNDAPDPPIRPGPQLDPRLILVSDDPLNAEMPLQDQLGIITPTPLFFLRNRFSMPDLSAGEWSLTVDGRVHTPLTLSYRDVLSLPHQSFFVTLECAGNGRTGLSPIPQGEPWCYGAVSTAEWTGVPLTLVLQKAGVDVEAREILFEGTDGGVVTDGGERVPFARSLPLSTALHPDTLLAFAMNGEILPREHGFPLRLIVPGWYGMASVKWLRRITAIDATFDGFFQTARYVMVVDEKGPPSPLTQIRVRSIIVEPATGTELRRGPIRIEGYAWSGSAPPSLVEVSVDGGASWHPTRWSSPEEQYAWRRWEYTCRLDTPGDTILQSRAWDAAGNVQPSVAEWNELGYANNGIQSIPVTVTARQ